jgi:EmrB/QacA subfamily drug resistance transporter
MVEFPDRSKLNQDRMNDKRLPVDKTPPQKWLVLFSIGIGTFMTALDTSVVNTVLPVISKSLYAEISTVEWIVTIYLLVLSGLLLSFGRLGDLRGHKTIYIIGFIVFLFGSVLCGIASKVHMLIIFRALQALGAAMLSANSPAILTKNFPDSERGKALGLQATMTYLGLTVGPSLGGWLATQLGWRFVFFINIPVAMIAIWLSLRSIPNDSFVKQEDHFDTKGALIFLLGLSALLLPLNQGYRWGWNSVLVISMLFASIILLGLFIHLERSAKHPMLDLSLFKESGFSLAVSSAVFNYIGVFSVIFLMPFYLIQGRDLTAAQAGLLLTAQPIVMAIIAPISGTLSDYIGTRIPSTFGMFILSAGILMLSRLDGMSTDLQIIISMAVVGFGTGTFISPNNSALMGSAPRDMQGIAAGVLATARNFGMVLGVGLAGAIFTTSLVQGGPGTVPDQLGNPMFYDAIHVSFMVSTGVTFLGAITSAKR